jgi:hypothetical protein
MSPTRHDDESPPVAAYGRIGLAARPSDGVGRIFSHRFGQIAPRNDDGDAA